MQPDSTDPSNYRRPSPLWQLVRIRLKEFYREPAAVFWTYCFPLMMTFTLGLAFDADPKESYRLVVVDQAGALSVMNSFKADDRFQVSKLNLEDARIQLRTGKTDLVLIPEPSAESAEENSMSGSMKAGAVGEITYWYDPRNQASDLARKAIDDFLQRGAGREDAFVPSIKVMDEPGGRYIDFLVPGLICMNLMGSGLWGLGFAVVDMRIRGLLKRFIATPMKRRDFLLASMISRMFFLIPELLLVLVFAWWVFEFQIFGSIALVLFLILLGSFQFAGIGLLIASRASTIETVSGLMNLVMLPNWIFAGIFFSSSTFPPFMQWFVNLLPLTPLVNSMRAVMLEGQGVAGIFPELIIITAWTVISFALALRFFRWN